MSKFGNRLKSLRTERGFSQDQLAALVKLSRGSISNYEAGIREPEYEVVEAFADIFNVDTDYLFGRSDVKRKVSFDPNVPPGFQPLPELSTVPLVGRIACGQPITAEENVEGYVSIPSAWRATFTLMCEGDSMAPRIQDGDLVAIRKQTVVENGEIAAVRIGDEATLKRVYFHDDYIELRPENPAYSSIIRRREEMNDVSIEGRAVGFCRGL